MCSQRGGVYGGDRCRRVEEGDGCGVFVPLVFNPAHALKNSEYVALSRDEQLADLLIKGA